ncbi:MAG TPA: hypothetical protein VF202_05000 [Trueperaceae bacterium]|jgi:hypothetical protein
MKKLLLALSLLPFSFAWAQLPVVGEVQVETDEFTGEQTCYQLVALPDTSLAMSLWLEDGELEVWFIRRADDHEFIYDGHAIPSMDRVLVKIGDVVETHSVVFADYVFDDWMEYAVIQPPRDFYDWFLSATSDVRVRFESDYSGLHRDVTVPHGFVTGFASGFAATCL